MMPLKEVYKMVVVQLRVLIPKTMKLSMLTEITDMAGVMDDFSVMVDK
jgi:hypothetical protein